MHIGTYYKCIYTLSFYIVRVTYHGRFHYGCVHINSILYLGSANTMTGYVQHVIHTPGNAVITFLITKTAVACKIFTGVSRKIGLAAAFMVTIGSTQHTRPREL